MTRYAFMFIAFFIFDSQLWGATMKLDNTRLLVTKFDETFLFYKAPFPVSRRIALSGNLAAASGKGWRPAGFMVYSGGACGAADHGRPR